MTFLKREMLRKKPSLLVFGLVVVASVLFGGYVLFLAILAPQQLAEATTAATDLICDKCVGTSDIADSAVTSAKIGSGQVKNSDMGNSAVTSGKILDGTIVSGDMANQAIISTKIADSAVTSSKLAGGAVKPTVHKVQGNIIIIAPSSNGNAQVDCPPGEKVTGGGYGGSTGVIQVSTNLPYDENTWSVGAKNVQSGANAGFVCSCTVRGSIPVIHPSPLIHSSFYFFLVFAFSINASEFCECLSLGVSVSRISAD